MNENSANDLENILNDCVSSSNDLPVDMKFYTTAYADLKRDVVESKSQTLRQLNMLLKMSNPGIADVADTSDLVARFESDIVDMIDNCLERADTLVDKAKGKQREASDMTVAEKTTANGSSSLSTKFSFSHDPKSSLPASMKNSVNLMKPQIKFKMPIDNSTETPFVPRLTRKPNAKVPLSLKRCRDNVPESVKLHLQSLGIYDTQAANVYLHPYEHEINTIEYPAHATAKIPEKLYTAVERTQFKWIDTADDLHALADVLEGVTEIAIDLEHHDYRTYQGFACLIQVSTRTQDYIIDALELRDELHVLNTSFTDPKIVKVLHGASMDTIWLQRDFGLYIVNLFDTYHASHALEMPKHSLAYLLKYYCNLEVDKKYQMADWRIRPIPDEMLYYARADTHYLLYVYDRMRNELVTRSTGYNSLINTVLTNSAQVCLNLYVKPVYNATVFETALGKVVTKDSMSARQVLIYKNLHAWRDQKARELDESVRFLIPAYTMITIAKEAPSTSQEVARLGQLTPLLRKFTYEIAEIVRQSLQEGDIVQVKRLLQIDPLPKVPCQTSQHIVFGEECEESSVIGNSSSEPVESVTGEAVTESFAKSALFGCDSYSDPESQHEVSASVEIDRITYTKSALGFSSDTDSNYTDQAKPMSDDVGNDIQENTVHLVTKKSALGFDSDEESDENEDALLPNSASLSAKNSADEQSNISERLFGIKAEMVLPVMIMPETHTIDMSIDITTPTEPEKSAEETPDEKFLILSSMQPKSKRKKPESAQCSSQSPSAPRKKSRRFESTLVLDDKLEGTLTLQELQRMRAETYLKSNKKRTRESPTLAVFDPFSTVVLDPALKKKDARMSVRTKSGIRQMTFQSRSK